MNYKHNQYIFKVEKDELQFLRDFDGMYADCEDPHGQSKAIENLSYQLVLTAMERAVAILRDDRGDELSILDIGCGLGYFTAHLKEKFPEAFVCGVDISQTALTRAAQIASGCAFRQADIKEITTVDSGKPFNIIVALDCLYYFNEEEIECVLTNIYALMAEGGFLMVGYHLPEEMRFGRYIRSLDDARTLFERYGISIVYSFDVENSLDLTYSGTSVGRHLYFLARKRS